MVDILYTVSVTLKYLRFYKYSLIKHLLIPFVLFMTFVVISRYYQIHPFFSVFVLIILLMKNAIIIHRIIILGVDSVERFSIVKLSKRDFNYLAFQIVTILIVMMVPLIILTLTSVTLDMDSWPNNSAKEAISIFQWIGYYLIARVCLLFPLLAIDKKMTLAELWVTSKQYQVMLFGIVAIIPFIITTLFQFLIPTNEIHWLSMLIFLLVSLFTVSMLSVAFIRIKEEQGQLL